eukprot:4983891-Pyramimonas_sp.AAC.1
MERKKRWSYQILPCRRGDAVVEVGIRAKTVGAVLRFIDDDLRARQKFFKSSGSRVAQARECWTRSYRMLLPDGSEGLKGKALGRSDFRNF